MDHWFDDLARRLAIPTVSRRDALRIGLATTGWSLFGSTAAFAKAASGQTEAAPSPTSLTHARPCNVAVRGQQLVLTFFSKATLATKPIAFAKIVTKDLGLRGCTTDRTSISFAGASVMEIDSRRDEAGLTPPITVVSIRFGKAITGMKEVLLTTDGKVLHGEFDGRAILPFAIGADPATMKFQDGKPAPKVSIQPGTQLALQTIFAKAEQDALHCRSSEQTRPVSGLPVAPDADPPDTGRSDDTYGTTSCRNCLGACVALGIAAGIGAAVCCAATFGLACAACVAAAAAATAFCIHQCQTSTDCCPVPCGEVACCFGGDSCLDPNRGVCCGPGLVPCHSRECCGESDDCLPNGTCCPQGQAVCNQGTVCCQPGQACSTEGICCTQFQPNVLPVSCNGVCCAADEVCKDGVACCPALDPICNTSLGPMCCRGGACDSNGNCCGPPSHVCGGVCCPPFNKCCGNTCCDINAQCIDGACCPQSQACGNICCPAGQPCQNPSTGTCGTCPRNTVLCPQAALCCPPNTICCFSQCCSGNEICCGVAGCTSPQGCVE